MLQHDMMRACTFLRRFLATGTRSSLLELGVFKVGIAGETSRKYQIRRSLERPGALASVWLQATSHSGTGQ